MAKRTNYSHKSARARIEELFLDNVGQVLTRDEIREAARNPKTGRISENWHQRLSELRTDYGYTIQSWRNRGELRVMEYLMPTAERRPTARRRVKIRKKTWNLVLERAGHMCEWEDGGVKCQLHSGEIDPISGGCVRLTPDHRQPHSIHPETDSEDPSAWQALCSRHQVVKKNYWDHRTGKLNVYAIVQSAPEETKREVYEFLCQYFSE